MSVPEPIDLMSGAQSQRDGRPDAEPGSTPLPFWASVVDDIRYHLDPAVWPQSRRRWVWLGLRIMLRSSGFRLALLYRIGHSARAYAGLPGRCLAGLLFWLGRHWYGCSIASTARLHGGFMLPHPQGIIIGGLVELGPRSIVFQNVTLGGGYGRGGSSGMPRIGADARIFAGAVVAGPVVVGDGVMIGANAVVTRDVPSHTLVRPAEIALGPLPEWVHNLACDSRGRK